MTIPVANSDRVLAENSSMSSSFGLDCGSDLIKVTDEPSNDKVSDASLELVRQLECDNEDLSKKKIIPVEGGIDIDREAVFGEA